MKYPPDYNKCAKTIRTENPPLSIARYSVIQLSELEQGRVNEPAQGSTRHHRIHTWLFS